jgi:hypothetical protein
LMAKYLTARVNKKPVSNFHTEDLSGRFLKNYPPSFNFPLNGKIESTFMTNYISAMTFISE